MSSRAHRTFFVLYVVVVAPVGAAVVVSVLLLFGVPPRMVFAPGWAVLSFLRQMGRHPPNALGVASTVGLWWLLFVVIGIAWERMRRTAGTRAH